MRNLFSIAIISAIIMAATPTLAHDEGAHATYLGNEGVLIARGDTKILFDAFYANSYGQYALVPDDIVSAMMEGAAPYDGIDAIFVSHVHGDHFSAEPAVEYMRAHTDVQLYGSQQVYDAIIKSGVAEDDPIMARIHGYTLAPSDDAVSFNVGEINVGVVAVPHAGNRPHIQNYVWRVTLDDKTTVMHFGDAGPVVSDFSRHIGHFNERKTHMAFPPYWFLGHDDGEMILRDIIDADHVVGVHVPKRAKGKGDKWRKDAGGDLFTDPGETRDIGED